MTAQPSGVGNEVLFHVVDQHIAIITLNRPSKRNAINGTVALAVDYLIKKIEADDALRVGILASCSTDFFCAGADLGEVAAGRVYTLVTPDGGLAGFADARPEKPWIAAVSGSVLAGG